MRRLPIAAVLFLLLCAPVQAKDYASTAYSVLPPGNGGTVPTGPNSLDQLALYDRLTPLFGDVSAADLKRNFKPNVFGTRGQRPVAVEKTPNKRVRIAVDRWGVPHITAKKRVDVMFGVGWMFAKERGLLLELARGPGRLTMLDPPGIDAFGLITTLRQFQPSAQADAIVRRQVKLLTRKGPQRAQRRQLLADIDAYVRGINAQYEAADNSAKPWTRTDFFAIAGFIGSIFGRGGGGETTRSMFLDALRGGLGADTGSKVFEDLRFYKDAEASTSIPKRFDYGQTPTNPSAARVVDDGSFTPVGYAEPARRQMSNAQLIAGTRTAARRPVFVGGPQLGYYYPQIVYEVDLHSRDGLDARGITSAGAGPYVFIGRGQDFSWTLTSANNDIVDTYVEKLCGGSDTKYEHKGSCRDMTSVDAGVLQGSGDIPPQRLRWNETVHGPVVGYATVGGERVAISRRRSTRGREALSLLAFQDLNMNRVRSAKDFLRTMPKLEHTFNAHYADSKDIAFISTGRLPVRPNTQHPGLPVDGSGDSEWRGFITAKQHPQQINPRSGSILNWNNLPAPGWGAADDEWGYHRLHRNALFDPLKKGRRHTPASVASGMNRPATQDVRNQLLLPVLSRVLDGGAAPSTLAGQLHTILKDWRAQGSSRLDRDLDNRIDHPGAAVMDRWWPKLADAAMGGVLTPALLERLAQVAGRGNRGGSAWVGYLDKDLRTVLGEDVEDKFRVRYCGRGDLAACRTALWASLEATAGELAAEQGGDPNTWRADATAERVRFVPNVIPDTMRWANRPTYQQIMQFKGEAP